MHADSMDLSSTDSTAVLLHKRSQSRDELSTRHRSISRCRNPSTNWSSTEGSIETMSIAISELTENLNHQILPPSPDHLVNRKELLDKLGMTQKTQQDFNPTWTTNTNENYDIPKNNAQVIKKTSEKRMVAATPCACDGGQPILNPYENYDIPKHVSQEALQFYDTPR